LGNPQTHRQGQGHELYAEIELVDRSDITTLETLASRLDRACSLPTWPVDLQLVAQLFGYGIIPPFAWAAAALVENFVDRLSRSVESSRGPNSRGVSMLCSPPKDFIE